MKITTVTTLLLVAFFCAPATGSNLVTFQITATVDTVVDPLDVLGGNILVGDTMTGILQYDLDLTDDDPDGNYGIYFSDPPGDNFIEGSNGASGNFETIDYFEAVVSNGYFGVDLISFSASGDTTPSAIAHPSVEWVDLDILLTDTDSTVFSGDSLPASLNLADFEEKQLILSGERWDEDISDYATTFEVFATITTIPEPNTLLLGALASVGLLMRSRKPPQ